MRMIATGAYTPDEGRGTGVTTWALDEATGVLTPLAEVALPSPSWVAWHPHRPVLYAVHEVDDGAVTALAVDDAGGLRVLGTAPTGGAAPCHLTTSPDGRNLLVANYGGGSVAVFALDADGHLGERTDLVVLTGSGPDPDRQRAPHPHQVVVGASAGVDSGGAELDVLVPDLGTDALRRYRLGATGQLVAPVVHALPPGTGPRQVLASGARALVLGELTGQLLALEPSGPGTLSVVAGAPTSGATGTTFPAQLLALGLEERVLVSNRTSDTVAVLDARSLQRVAEHPLRAAWPRHVVLVGDLLLAAGERGDVVVTHRLRPDGAHLEELSRQVTGSPTCVAPRAAP